MSKFEKITLLALAVFLVLGFSITANAGNPWLKDKEQTITSAPLRGLAVVCRAVNITDETILVDFNLYYTAFAPVPASIPDVELAPKEAEGWYVTATTITEPTSMFCTVSWEGQPGDVKGSICAFEINDPEPQQGIGCLGF
jgi:hypothetical protein